MIRPDSFLPRIVGIAGAGAMGRGIAQIVAQAGLTVRLYDLRPDAAAAARDELAAVFARLVAKRKLTAAAAQAALQQLHPAAQLAEFADCDVVIEAIAEQLDAKRALFAELETIVRADCILASNTSSLSITAIAAACRRPARVAGFHCFNPVPLMKVVEVVDGLHTAPAAGDALTALARHVGHVPVRAKDMPGFIVNHAGRGMTTEGLRIVGEGVADYAEVDRIVREQAGFRLGPFELLDLTALDVSHPVMESIYRQFYDEPRFRPSPLTAIRLAGGLLGRKSGAGFYAYRDDGERLAPAEAPAPLPDALPRRVWIAPPEAGPQTTAQTAARDAVAALAAAAGVTVDDGLRPADDALLVIAPFGLDATTAALDAALDPARTVAVDALFGLAAPRRRTVMATPAAARAVRDAAHALFAADGAPVTVIRDSGGFVAQRIVATIVNVAADIAQQRIAAPTDVDLAVTLGLGYPQGPLALGDALGAPLLLTVLQNLQRVYGDPRYRPSPWLARRAQLGLSLLHYESA